MTNSTFPDFDALSRLNDSLPPVPWVHHHDPDSWSDGNTIVDADSQVLVEGDVLWERYVSYLPDHDIPTLLAQLRNALPALLGRIRALEESLTEAQAQAWDEGYQKHIERTWAMDGNGVLPDTSNPYRKK